MNAELRNRGAELGINRDALIAGYLNQGMALVPIPRGKKGPTHPNWNVRERCVTTLDQAAKLQGNIGLAHAFSSTCSIDIDDLAAATAWLAGHGVDLAALLNALDSVRISSGRPNRAKLIYRLTAPLASKKIVEDKQNIIDFRCATAAGTTSVQDVLPPSTHPDTGKPYVWEYGDELIGDWRNLPTIPDELLRLWKSLIAPASSEIREPTQPIDESKLRELLTQHDPDCDRETWVKRLAAIHYETQGGPNGLELAIDWSSRGKKFKSAADVESVWRSFHNDGDRLITGASLRVDKSDADGFDTVDLSTVPQGPPADPYTTYVDLTDTGNANLLIKIANGNVRYIPESHSWLWWQNERWMVDGHETVLNTHALKVAKFYAARAKKVLDKIPSVTDKDDRKRLEEQWKSLDAWAKRCRNRRALTDMTALTAKADGVPLSLARLDRNPWLLGVENGVVDLHNGTLQASEVREEYVTKRCPVKFDPAARAPRWGQFIAEITGTPLPVQRDPLTDDVLEESVGLFTPRPHLSDYMQRMLGYFLTGATNEHKMFIAIGEGSNGKNVLFETVLKLLGGYAVLLPAEAIMAAKHQADAERPTPLLRSLAGARFALASETKDKHRLDVGTVKNATGDTRMTARGMRENAFSFDITHKLCLMTNHRPALDHLDTAIRGRLHLIPFDRRWNRPGDTERDLELPDGDKDLANALRSEAEGILAWLVKGAVLYSRSGLAPPPEVVALTRSYFNEQDHFGRWLEEYGKVPAKNGTRAGDLFEAFAAWCMADGIEEWQPSTEKAFALALKKRGIESVKVEDGRRYGLAKS